MVEFISYSMFTVYSRGARGEGHLAVKPAQGDETSVWYRDYGAAG